MDSLSGVGVLDKAVAILRALQSDGPMALAELQDTTGLPRATAHRLALALEAHDLVRRDADGHFALGFALIGLGHAATDQFALAEAARPVLERLRDDTGESVQLYVREGDGRRCVVSLQSPHGLRWIVPEGALLPLERGSAGRILRATRRELTAHGGTPTPGAVNSWVESVEERERGVASVSAPVLDAAGDVIAAVSVSGPIERMSRSPGARFGKAVADAAAEIRTARFRSG